MTTLAKHILRDTAVQKWMRDNYVTVFMISAYGVNWGHMRQYLMAFYDLAGVEAIDYGADLALRRLEIGLPMDIPADMNTAVALAEDVTAHYTMRQLFIPDETHQNGRSTE